MCPIIGITDQAAAFPILGILRKGGPKTDPKKPGPDLKFFRFTSEYADVQAAFQYAYGLQPTDVNVFLPYPTAEENMACWKEEWQAGGLVHRCDGVTCVLWRDEKGKYSTKPKPCPGGCKPVGRLSVIIPELRRLASVTVLTTSIHDTMNLMASLRAMEMLKHGDVRGIPMVLHRRPRMISTPSGDGKRARREKWLLTIEADSRWVELQLAAQEAAAIPQLPAGVVEELEMPEDENGVEVDEESGEILSTVVYDVHDAGTSKTVTTPVPVYATADEAIEAEFIEAFVEQEAAEAEELPPIEEPERPPMPREEAAKVQAEPGEPTGGSQKALLLALNKATGGMFNSAADVIKAIRLEAGNKEWMWPMTADDRDAWNAAYKLAMAFAQKNK
jgi:hypothetical protein